MNDHWLDIWHVNPSTNKDYDVVDGLRGMAILLVIACHLVYVNPKAGAMIRFLGDIFAAGSLGVVVFFTLSGFLISSPFWKRKLHGSSKKVPTGYGWRRFYKIYPPLAVSILVLTPIYIFRSGDWSYIGSAAKWLIGLPLILPVNGHLNPVMWTLLVEVQFYIFLPLLFLLLQRVPAKTCLWVIPLTLFALGQGSRLIYYFAGIHSSIKPIVSIPFPAFLDFFTLGVMLSGLENFWHGLPRRWAKLGHLGLFFLLLAVTGSAWLNFRPSSNSSLKFLLLEEMSKLASVLLLCYIANPQKLAARVLCHPWLRWCGIISYEWYLCHQPIILWTRASLGPADGNVIKYISMVGGSFVFSLVLAAAFYRYFSLPILRLGRSKHNSNDRQVEIPYHDSKARF